MFGIQLNAIEQYFHPVLFAVHYLQTERFELGKGYSSSVMNLALLYKRKLIFAFLRDQTASLETVLLTVKNVNNKSYTYTTRK